MKTTIVVLFSLFAIPAVAQSPKFLHRHKTRVTKQTPAVTTESTNVNPLHVSGLRNDLYPPRLR